MVWHPVVVDAAEVNTHEPEANADVLVGHELQQRAVGRLHHMIQGIKV